MGTMFIVKRKKTKANKAAEKFGARAERNLDSGEANKRNRSRMFYNSWSS